MTEGLSHEEIRELLGAYVVGALADETEREAVAAHLEWCEECQAEENDLRLAAEQLRQERAEWDEAAQEVWERVRAEVRRRPRNGGTPT